ncbi:hypothetical protein ACKKBF_B03360 [Auxenochlorella protothecoides x Auxenochlorella symbiontica]
MHLAGVNVSPVPSRNVRVTCARPGSRARCLRVSAVANFVRTSPGREAVLCQKFKGHDSAVAASLVFEDSEQQKLVVTSSLDKSLRLWSSNGNTDSLCSGGFTKAADLNPEGGPIFSLIEDERSFDGLTNQIFLGKQARQIVAWVPPRLSLDDKVVLGDHKGWVRALATSRTRWLFSGSCTQLRVWDLGRAVPRCVATASVDRGDIVCLAANGDAVYAGTADGSIWMWSVGKKGELKCLKTWRGAHADRVTALVLRGETLYSASYDGSIKAWSAEGLDLLIPLEGAHCGQRINCMTAGPDGLLYSGGDDKLLRRWVPSLLMPAAAALHCHHHSVRSIAAGSSELLVSGDKSGELAIWKLAGPSSALSP